MARRRLLKSYFYIVYNGQSYGGAVSVSPFDATGGTDTFRVVSNSLWEVDVNTLPAWISLDVTSGSVGYTDITITVGENTGTDEKTGVITVGTSNGRYAIPVSCFQDGNAPYVRVNGQTTDFSNVISCSATTIQYEIVSRGGWTFASEGTSTCTSDITGVTTEGHDTTIITVSYGDNPITRDVNNYAFRITSNKDASKNVLVSTLQRPIPYVNPGEPNGLPYTGVSSLSIGLRTNADYVTFILPSEGPGFSVNPNPVFRPETATSYSYVTNYLITCGSLSSSQTGNTHYQYDFSAVTDDNHMVSRSIDYEPWPYIIAPNITVNSATTGGSENLQSNYNLELVNADTGITVNVYSNNVVTYSFVNPVGFSDEVYEVTVRTVPTGSSSEVPKKIVGPPIDKTFTITRRGQQVETGLFVTPSATSIGTTATTQLTAIYRQISAGTVVETDVTSGAGTVWTSSDSGTAEVNASGYVTAHNNTSASKTVTITATYNGLSDTSVITVAQGVQNWRNFRILIGGTESTANQPLYLNPSSVNSRLLAFIDEYRNNTKIQSWGVSNTSVWTYDDPSSAITHYVDQYNAQVVNPVYESGTYYPTQRTAKVTATVVQGSTPFTAEKYIYVEPAGYKEYVLEVSPMSVSLPYNGSTGLTANYCEYTDGVKTGESAVTSTATYSSNNTAVTVSNIGVITANNTGTSAINAIIGVEYSGLVKDVSVTVAAQGETYLLEVSADTQSISCSGTANCTATYVTMVGQTVVNRQDVTNSATWSIVTGSQYASVNSGIVIGANEDTSSAHQVEVEAVYNGVSDALVITVGKKPSITHSLEIVEEVSHGTVYSAGTYVVYDGGNVEFKVLYKTFIDGIEDVSQDVTSLIPLASAFNPPSANTTFSVGLDPDYVTIVVSNLNMGESYVSTVFTATYSGETDSVSIDFLTASYPDTIILSADTTSVSYGGIVSFSAWTVSCDGRTTTRTPIDLDDVLNYELIPTPDTDPDITVLPIGGGNVTFQNESTTDSKNAEMICRNLNSLEESNLVTITVGAKPLATFVLSFQNNPVLSDTTANTFTLTTDNMHLETIGYYAAGSSNILSCSLATSSVTFAANTGYTDRTITLALTGESNAGEILTASSSFVQSKVIVVPQLSIAYTGGQGSKIPASGGETSAFSLTKAYITSIDQYSVEPSQSGEASIVTSGQNGLTVACAAYSGSTDRTFTVYVTGTDVYNEVHTASTTFVQSADVASLALNPSSQTVQSSAIATNIEIVSANINNIGITGYTGVITSATISGNNVHIEYPENLTLSSRTMSVGISGMSNGGRVLTANATLTQEARQLEPEISVAATQTAVTWDITANTFTVSWTDIYGTIQLAPSDCTISGGNTIVADGSGSSVISVTFPQNVSSTPVIISLDAIYDEIDAFDSFEQAAKPTYQLSFVVTPADSNYTITVNGSTFVNPSQIVPGTQISWNVSAPHFATQSGSFQMPSSDTAITVTLVQNEFPLYMKVEFDTGVTSSVTITDILIPGNSVVVRSGQWGMLGYYANNDVISYSVDGDGVGGSYGPVDVDQYSFVFNTTPSGTYPDAPAWYLRTPTQIPTKSYSLTFVVDPDVPVDIYINGSAFTNGSSVKANTEINWEVYDVDAIYEPAYGTFIMPKSSHTVNVELHAPGVYEEVYVTVRGHNMIPSQTLQYTVAYECVDDSSCNETAGPFIAQDVTGKTLQFWGVNDPSYSYNLTLSTNALMPEVQTYDTIWLESGGTRFYSASTLSVMNAYLSGKTFSEINGLTICFENNDLNQYYFFIPWDVPIDYTWFVGSVKATWHGYSSMDFGNDMRGYIYIDYNIRDASGITDGLSIGGTFVTGGDYVRKHLKITNKNGTTLFDDDLENIPISGGDTMVLISNLSYDDLIGSTWLLTINPIN